MVLLPVEPNRWKLEDMDKKRGPFEKEYDYDREENSSVAYKIEMTDK